MNKSNSNLAAQFNRTHISVSDFVEAADYLNAIRPEKSATVQRAMLLAAIVAYARPFSKNKGRSGDQATPYLQVHFSKVFTQEERSLHRRLIALRNEALAHSQYDRKAVARISGSDAAIRRSFECEGFVVQCRFFDVLSEGIDRNVFSSLCLKMKRHCTIRLFSLNQKLSSFD